MDSNAISSGIVTVVKAEQSKKAQFLMIFTPLPKVTFVSAEQLRYLQPVITQYFASNKSEIWS